MKRCIAIILAALLVCGAAFAVSADRLMPFDMDMRADIAACLETARNTFAPADEADTSVTDADGTAFGIAAGGCFRELGAGCTQFGYDVRNTFANGNEISHVRGVADGDGRMVLVTLTLPAPWSVDMLTADMRGFFEHAYGPCDAEAVTEDGGALIFWYGADDTAVALRGDAAGGALELLIGRVIG